jgi:CHASE2 domain-containing sensor protein
MVLSNDHCNFILQVLTAEWISNAVSIHLRSRSVARDWACFACICGVAAVSAAQLSMAKNEQ